MARGWESKSVEEQRELQSSSESPKTGKLDAKEAAAQAARTRQREALELQRERILSERTSSPIRRQALQAALASIEARLREL